MSEVTFSSPFTVDQEIKMDFMIRYDITLNTRYSSIRNQIYLYTLQL